MDVRSRVPATFLACVALGVSLIPALAAADNAPTAPLGGLASQSASEARATYNEELAGELPGSSDTLIAPLSGRPVLDWRGKHEAVVGGLSSGPDLVASTFPLGVRDGSDELRPVDLALEATSDGYAPTNPIQPGTSFPADLVDGIEAGRHISLSVEAAGSNDAAGQPADGNSVFYGNVDSDTDVVTQPLPRGIEVAFVMRSPASPESQDLHLELPDQASASIDTGGDVVIASGNRQIAVVLAPSATDSAGRAIPASYDLSDNALTVSVQPDQETAYPILVDPIVWEPESEEEAVDPPDLPGAIQQYGRWSAYSNVEFFTFGNSLSGDGPDAGDGSLYIGTGDNDPYETGSSSGPDATSGVSSEGSTCEDMSCGSAYGEWVWAAPPGYGISEADILGSTYRGDVHENDPQGLVGLYSTDQESFTGSASEGFGVNAYAWEFPYQNDTFDPTVTSSELTTDRAVVAEFQSPISSDWNGLAVMGATFSLTLRDEDDPSLDASGSLTESGTPLAGAYPDIDIDATDLDSGVTSVVLKVDDEEVDEISQDCPYGGCSLEDTMRPDLSELAPGEHDWDITATDGVGNTKTESGSFELDPTAPELTVTGDLADADGLPLSTETADADIDAADEQTGDSGVASIEVSVEDTVDQTDGQTCAPACPATASTGYTYDQGDWSEGHHNVTVTAVDAAGNETQRIVSVNEADEREAECPEPSASIEDAVDPVSASSAGSQAIDPAVAASDPGSSASDETPIDPSIEETEDPDELGSVGSLADDTVGVDPASGLTVGEVMCMMPLETTEDETDAVISGDVSVHANSNSETDTVIRPTATGESVILSLRGGSAPGAFSWKVGMPEGDELVELPDGGVAVVNPEVEASPPSVPSAPVDAQDPESIPDVDMQLALEAHESAYAEDETGHAVDAVIPPAYSVDEQGGSYPAILDVVDSDTLVVDADERNAEALVVSPSMNTKRVGHEAVIFCKWCKIPHNTARTDGSRDQVTTNYAETDSHLHYGIYEDHKGHVYHHHTGLGPGFLYAGHGSHHVPLHGLALCENREDVRPLLAWCSYVREKHS